MAWFRACKKLTAFLFTIGFIIGGTLSGLLVNEWFDRVYLPARLHNLSPLTLSIDYYLGTSHAFGTHETRTIRRKKKRIKIDKPTVDTTEPEKTTQPMLIQTHATAKQRNSARKGKRLLQRKLKPKCNFSDINTFKNCYVLRNYNKTWHDSSKQCQKRGLQLADMGSQEELNFVRKFLKKHYNIDSLEFTEKARKARNLDPVGGFVEKTWLSLFGIPEGRNQKERAKHYKKKGWFIGGIEKTWTKTFGEYYVPSQAYWISNVHNASAGTPTTHLRRMQRKENGCMSISPEGNNRTDCQLKLPFICEYNKWG